MSEYVGLAKKSDSEAVTLLRVQEYASAAGFKVDRSAIEWNASDDQCSILGIWSENQLVSTMRVELVNSSEVLEKKLECPWEFGAIEYPVMILSKAATRADQRGKGCNAFLRYWAVKFACDWKIPYLVGTFVSGSPRIRTMEKMGYEFYENKLGWHAKDYRSERTVLVAKLDIRRFGKQAIETLVASTGIIPSALPWQGDFPSPQFVTRIK